MLSSCDPRPARDLDDVDLSIVTRDLARAANVLSAIARLHVDAPNPSDEEPSRVRAAYHEAGHAVVARALGIKVAGITVRQDGTGVCDIDGNVLDAGEEVFSAVAWAGYVGEAVAAQFCVREHFDDWWYRGDDAFKVGSLTFDAPEAAAAGVVRAAEIVSAESGQLDALARALIEHGSAWPDPEDPKGWCFPA